MEIIVKKDNGYLKINEKYIIEDIKNSVELVPGVISIGKNSLIKEIKRKLNLRPDSIQIYPIVQNEIGIFVSVYIEKEMNFHRISEQIQDIIRYNLKEKYGIKVNFIDVFVEGTK